MKIAIPTDENTIGTPVCISFGRAPYFMIHDSDSGTTTFIENSAADSPGGAGIKAAQLIVDNKVQMLLTPRCGDNAAQVLKAASIGLFRTIGGTAMENVQAFLADNLTPLTETHAGFHNHGEK